MGLALVALAGILLPLAFNQVVPDRDLNMDESLHLLWADHWASTSDWWIEHPLYTFVRPPIYPLVVGSFLRIFGNHRWVVLLPNLLFGAGTLYAVFRLATVLSGALAAWMALIVITTSGFWNFYVYSCFTDPGLALFTSLAVLCAAHSRWRSAGAMAAMAIGTKQFGLAILPFVAFLAIFTPSPVPRERDGERVGRQVRIHWKRLGLVASGALPILILLLIWELAGHHYFHAWLAGSPVPLGIQSADAIGKLQAWLGQLSEESCLGGAGLALAIGSAIFIRGKLPSLFPLISFLLGYAVLMAVSTIPPEERYKLWIFPLVAVVAACGLAKFSEWAGAVRPRWNHLVRFSILGLVTLSAIRSLEAPLPPIEMIRYGLVDIFRTELSSLSPPGHVLIPIDVRWEVTSWLQLERKTLSLESYSGSPQALADAITRNRNVDVYVLGVDTRLLSPAWAPTFERWNAIARRKPWRLYRSKVMDYHYELVRIPKR